MAEDNRDKLDSVDQSLALPDRIVALLPQMSKKQKQIARFILNNQEYVAFASAADVGERTRSSAATVVRSCQVLGYQGFIHLQMAVREGLSIQRTAVQRLEERLVNPPPEMDVYTRVFATDIHNIERLVVLMDPGCFHAALNEITRARRILVVGDGLAAGMATFFTHALQVAGLSAQGIAGGGEPLALAVAFLQPDDLVIGIGFWRNLRDVVQAIEQARQKGVKTIGITDSKLSPLARLTDYPFLTATDGVAHSLSPVATVSLLNAFVAALSFEMPDQVVTTLRQVEEAYRQSDLLSE